MLYAYIGAAAVIGLLICFVTLCIIWLSKRVSAGIRNKTVDMISAYDVLLEKRSRELAALEEQIRQKEEQKDQDIQSRQEQPAEVNSAALSSAQRIAMASYRESAVGQTYRKIRMAFSMDPERALHRIVGKNTLPPEGPATRLLRSLEYATVYSLSTLSEEQQYQLLQSTLDREALELLDAFCKTSTHFGAIAFYDYLQAVADMEPQRPCLRVPVGYTGPRPAGAKIVEDQDICEGFQIEVNNQLYDYCIKGRELR